MMLCSFSDEMLTKNIAVWLHIGKTYRPDICVNAFGLVRQKTQPVLN